MYVFCKALRCKERLQKLNSGNSDQWELPCKKNMGGSNIWQMVENMRLARFQVGEITLVYFWRVRNPY